MKLKAKDTLHISSVKADNIKPGEEFEVGEAEGKDLVARGLATKVAAKAAARQPAAKAAAKPANKMKAPARNKRR